MVRVYCDYCGDEIMCADFQVTAELSACGFCSSDFDGGEYHYHPDCAQEVKKVLDRMRRAAPTQEGSRSRE